jgi:hypothetical protein
MRWRFAWAVLLAAPAFAQQSGIYTTKDESLPWLQKQQEQMPPGYQPSVPGKGDIPFQRATPYGAQAVPAPLPMDRSVPVENIDGIEVSEPAAPAEVPVGADPASEDPAQPTEHNSPLFSTEPDTSAPRTIVLRVLNKVTARAETLEAKPGETLQFGKLSIDARQCYQSMPNSQPDAVALLAIYEQLPDRKAPKLLFQGWMYGSSPSITALEHPIYDVTMVECRMNAPEAKELVDDAKAEKPKKKAN